VPSGIAPLRGTTRIGEAESIQRRALAIDEASYGENHPTVAIRLNNLATLLYATDRRGEAEPLMRRMLAIFFAFECATGHAHPHRDVAIENYAGLLAAMGRSEAEIRAALAALRS
jgi:hypothetical protein